MIRSRHSNAARRCALQVGATFAALALVALASAAREAPRELQLADFTHGAPAGVDAHGTGIGFVTWQDGGGSLSLSTETLAPDDPLALPDQRERESVLRIDHTIASWGGFSHNFADDALTRWTPRDLSSFVGLRFWYAGDGRGGTVQVDLFDNRNPNLPGDSAERWFYRFRDDTTDWRLVEIPFASFERRRDFQPSGAPNDGLGLVESWGWALGFPPGEGTSYVARVEAYGGEGAMAAEAPTIEFADEILRVREGDAATLRVVSSAPSDVEIAVRIAVLDDDARAGVDFVALDERVVFAAGETDVVVFLQTLGDGRHTGDRQAIAVLDEADGAELGFGRRARIVIEEIDPIDPDLIADFRDGSDGFTVGEGTRLEVVEAPGDAAGPRGRGARALALSWDEVGIAHANFAEAVDASHADGIEFWYRGDGSGRTVRVELLGARDAARGPELVWSDEFDGPAGAAPDPAAWTPEIGDGTSHGIPGWGNAERQTYTADPANVATDGLGHLAIRALEAGDDAPVCYYGGACEYTSARIVTAGAVEVRYGRVEARIRLPRGQGLWPAFWMLGNDLPEVGWPDAGEIDVVENVGREPTIVHGTIHGPGYSGGSGIGRGTTLPGGEAFADDFHVFAIDWGPGEITWSVDGEPYSTVTPDDLPSGATWVFDHPFFLILNVAVGGHWPGYPDDTTEFPQEMLVDYVRVYAVPDTAERFEAVFTDDVADWVHVRLPFSAFARSERQPDGAPEVGLGGGELWGVDIEIGGVGGSASIADVRWFVLE